MFHIKSMLNIKAYLLSRFQGLFFIFSLFFATVEATTTATYKDKKFYNNNSHMKIPIVVDIAQVKVEILYILSFVIKEIKI